MQLAAVAGLLCTLSVLPQVLGAVRVVPSTADHDSFFADESGRVMLFHGVNSVYKVSPYLPALDGADPLLSFSEDNCDDLARWGLNVVRLGLLWAGIEPQPDQFNMTYLNQARELVDRLGARGIYTLIELHQDAFSPYYCGEGMPDFVTKNMTGPGFVPFPGPGLPPFPTGPDGLPDRAACLQHSFFRYYFTADVAAAFQSIYDNVNGLADRLVRLWTAVAQKMASSPHVLGYELFNEPWAGDMYRSPALLVEEGLADRKNLAPLYDRLAEAVRSADPDRLVFFEPAVSDYGFAGFTTVPGGDEYRNRSAYSYHIYCSILDEHGDPRAQPFCDEDEEMVTSFRVADYRRLAVPGFLTEFGANSNTPAGVHDITHIAEMCDRNLQSWAYWQIKDFGDVTTTDLDGTEGLYTDDEKPQLEKVRALSRTYARRIAGIPLAMQFNSTTGDFRLDFTIDAAMANSTTEIYLNEALHYTGGLTVSVDGPAAWNRPTSNTITVEPGAGARAGDRVTVFVQRA